MSVFDTLYDMDYEPPGDPEPPKSLALEAERAFLGGLLISCERLWPAEAERLTPDHFECPCRARVFEAMLELRDRDEPIDAVTVLGALKDAKTPPTSGWATYLTDLTQTTPTAANVDHYAGLVLRESRRRDYVAVMTRAVNSASEPGADADQIAINAATELGNVADGRELLRPVTMREGIKA